MAADLVQLQAWLTEAQAAQQSLLTGKQAIEVSGPAGTVKFNAASTDRLAAYILNLQSQIAASSSTPSVNRPITFFF